MDEFLSTFTNRLDSKGRVSIPAPFRAVLARDGYDGLYCCPTLDAQAVDAGGNRLREMIRANLARFEPFSDDHEHLSTTFNGESELLRIDAEGRVILSEAIKARTGIADEVSFVGQGYKFQIWEPQRFGAYREEARTRVRMLRQASGAGRRTTGGQAGDGQ